MRGNQYVPALSLRWLTPFYDSLTERPIAALHMRKDLLMQIGDVSSRSLLDVGCGTGSFAILVKRAYPTASVTGLDGDPEILELARAKAANLGLDVRFSEAISYAMPYPDASFDFVVTSLMLHHLDKMAKQGTANEMFRVLKPGGRLFGIDFAETRGPLGRGIKPLARRLERVAENLDGLLPVMIGQAGFREYAELRRYVLGSIALFRATKPA